MKKFSTYASSVAELDLIYAEGRRQQREAEAAKLQAIIDKNIPPLDAVAAERRGRMRTLAMHHREVTWTDLACDGCGTELVKHTEDVGFGAGRREIFDCLGCGWNKSVTRMRP